MEQEFPRRDERSGAEDRAASIPRDQNRLLDAFCLVAVWVLAFSWVWWVTAGGTALPYDAFRDTAWSLNMVECRVWADPSMSDATWWYAPAGPALMAAVGLAMHADLPIVHAKSTLVLNPMIVVLLFLVVRRTADRWVGLAAVPFLLFGSMWWLTHIGAAMPSIQAVASTMLVVFLWTRCVDTILSGQKDQLLIVKRGVINGLVLGVAAWWHPVCAIVGAGAIALHGMGLCLFKRVRWRMVAAGVGAVAFSSVILAAPLMWHLLRLPQQNPAPMRYLAPEMANPDFAIGLSTPGVGVLAIIGLVLVLRNRPSLGWVPGLLGVSLLGQAPAYLPWWRDSGLAMLVPHEFQWHGQLAVAILAAIGLVEATRFATSRVRFPVGPAARSACIGGGLLLGILAPVSPYLQFGGVYLVDLEGILRIRQETVGWIMNNTSIDAVFACRPADAYMTVAGLTGRKCAVLPVGHTNPAVPAAERLDMVERMLSTHDEAEFLGISNVLKADFLLVIMDSAETVRKVQEFRGWSSLRQQFASEAERTVVFSIPE